MAALTCLHYLRKKSGIAAVEQGGKHNYGRLVWSLLLNLVVMTTCMYLIAISKCSLLVSVLLTIQFSKTAFIISLTLTHINKSSLLTIITSSCIADITFTLLRLARNRAPQQYHHGSKHKSDVRELGIAYRYMPRVQSPSARCPLFTAAHMFGVPRLERRKTLDSSVL